MNAAPIVIAAGGSGGHLFPAQALAQELTRRKRSIILLTDARVQRFDKLFPGAQVHYVPAATPSRRGLLGTALAGLTIARGVARSYGILRQLRPGVVVGFGGYPSLPPLLAARLRGIPICLHEQNAVLGRANRVLAPMSDAIASSFAEPKFVRDGDRKKLVATGNPVRDAVVAVRDLPFHEPDADAPFQLLVFGGSQGARVMSVIVPPALALLSEPIRRRLHVTQQCRTEDLEQVRRVYAEAGIEATLQAFFDDMPTRIAQAQLVIARSGASTASELAVIGRPAILIPLPHALDNDQKANAQILESAGAAWMIEERNLTAAVLSQHLSALFAAPERLSAAAKAAHALGKPEAVRTLADLVERLSVSPGEGTYGARPAKSAVKNTHRSDVNPSTATGIKSGKVLS